MDRFVEGIRAPHDRPANDPARLLAERFRKYDHRSRRRPLIQDWTMLVRALNLSLEGRTISKLVLSAPVVWPRIAETEADYRSRQNAEQSARARAVYRAERDAPGGRMDR